MINKIIDVIRDMFRPKYESLNPEEMQDFVKLMTDPKTGKSKFKETRYIEYALVVLNVAGLSFFIWLWM